MWCYCYTNKEFTNILCWAVLLINYCTKRDAHKITYIHFPKDSLLKLCQCEATTKHLKNLFFKRLISRVYISLDECTVQKEKKTSLVYLTEPNSCKMELLGSHQDILMGRELQEPEVQRIEQRISNSWTASVDLTTERWTIQSLQTQSLIQMQEVQQRLRGYFVHRSHKHFLDTI